MILPAISIKEPWATKIATGEKTIEVRSWKTKHRGKIILCASKNPDGKYAGTAFALAEILDVRPMEKSDCEKSRTDFYDGAYSWILGKVKTFKPFPMSGKPGLFKVDTATKSRA